MKGYWDLEFYDSQSCGAACWCSARGIRTLLHFDQNWISLRNYLPRRRGKSCRTLPFRIVVLRGQRSDRCPAFALNHILLVPPFPLCQAHLIYTVIFHVCHGIYCKSTTDLTSLVRRWERPGGRTSCYSPNSLKM